MTTSVNNDSLVIDFILQLEELSLFNPITGSRNERCKQQPTVNGQRFDIRAIIITKLGDSKVNSCSPHQENDVGVLELSRQKSDKRLNPWHSNEMSSEYLLPSLNIRHITNYTTVFISIEELTEAIVIATVSEDVKASSALALVVG